MVRAAAAEALSRFLRGMDEAAMRPMVPDIIRRLAALVPRTARGALPQLVSTLTRAAEAAPDEAEK